MPIDREKAKCEYDFDNNLVYDETVSDSIITLAIDVLGMLVVAQTLTLVTVKCSRLLDFLLYTLYTWVIAEIFFIC